jgi:hypothetical protein
VELILSTKPTLAMLELPPVMHSDSNATSGAQHEPTDNSCACVACLQHCVHAAHVEANAAPQRRHVALQAGARAERDEGSAVRRRSPHDARHLLRALWIDDGLQVAVLGAWVLVFSTYS